MKNRILSIFAAIAVALSLSACQNGDIEQTAPLSDLSVSEATTQESVKLPHGYENATVVDDETMDFLRSLLCIKGEPITFPCTYNELKNILDKHSITIKPSGCWSDDNPDNRDVCFVDLYDGETYFMAMKGTCVSEDDLESYIFDGTLVGEPAQNYISIDKYEPMHINKLCNNNILNFELIAEGNGIDLVQLNFKNNLYYCSLGLDVEVETNILKSFSISVDNIGGNNNE
ncbi:MAG: hypothetical protein IJ035_05325 [Oscillospiraceae bacterium]|nr:hypothetical protein [Oscillospiraceae bacterium]